MKISKNNYSPNDRFLIKIFIKIISLDSSQRVPPMSPCPPLIITTVCPWLINHLSDPWDCNNSNGILLRSNWRKPYPKFYGSSFYGSGCVYLGVVKKTSQKVPTYLPTWWGGEGLLIRCWHYIYTNTYYTHIYIICIYIYSIKHPSGNESFEQRFSLRGEGGRAYRGQFSGLRGAARSRGAEKNITGYNTRKSNGVSIISIITILAYYSIYIYMTG